MTSFVTPVASPRTEPPAFDEDEDGVAQGFPVPPLDLPHYHGLELGDTAPEPVSRTLGDAQSTKEVTGA